MVVIHHQGNTLDVPPVFPKYLKDAIRAKSAGVALDSLAPREKIWETPELTWIRQLVGLENTIREVGESSEERLRALWEILGAVADLETPAAVWATARPRMLARIDLLSGWDHSHYRGMDEIIREHAENTTIRMSGGRPRRMLDIKAEDYLKVSKWDYIGDSCIERHRPMQGITTTLCLLSICHLHRQSPEKISKSVKLVIHDPVGHHAPHWEWSLQWLYRPQAIPWRPDENMCDLTWLCGDLLAGFVEKEGIPVKDINPTEWPGSRELFDKVYAEYPRQLELVLDTPLIFGDAGDYIFPYAGRSLRWTNSTQFVHPVLVIPMKESGERDQWYETGLRFLSKLSFDTHQPITVLGGGESWRRPAPLNHWPIRQGGLHPGDGYRLRVSETSTAKQDLAYGLYREAISSKSVYYEFLSYNKIIQLVFGERRNGAKAAMAWVRANKEAARLGDPEAYLRADAPSAGRDPGDYLYDTCRCAIAHVSGEDGKPVVDPDNREDLLRIGKAVEFIGRLAEALIEKGMVK